MLTRPCLGLGVGTAVNAAQAQRRLPVCNGGTLNPQLGEERFRSPSRERPSWL